MKYLPAETSDIPFPRDVEHLIADATRRIEAFVEGRLDNPIHGFVPSDFRGVYRVLHTLATDMRGSCFVEWGSGFGVVATLAAKLGFDAGGIEYHEELVEAAEDLARDHGVDIPFARGTFVPHDAQDLIDLTEWPSWLEGGGHDGHEDLAVDPRDIDLVFAFPWPGEGHVVEAIFDRICSPGALLLTWADMDGPTLVRKEA